MADRPLRGILSIVAACALFSMSDTISKFLTGSLPPLEVAWLRYVTFAMMAGASLGRQGWRAGGMRSTRPALQAMRGVLLVLATITFIFGLQLLPLAEATAINFMSPGFITALSVVFLAERVGLHRWLATGAGLAGVLLVIRPGSDAFQLASLLPLGTAIFWAGAMVATRVLADADRTPLTIFWSASIGAAVLSLLLPLGWRTPDPAQLALAILLGVLSSSGQFAAAAAYRAAAASLVAPFSYVQLVSSTALGMLVFAAIPDRFTLLGAGIIIGSGIYTAQRERADRHGAHQPEAELPGPNGRATSGAACHTDAAAGTP